MRAKNMQSLTEDTRRRHPGVVIYGVGDEAHKLRYSDHNEDDTPGSKAAQSDADNVPEHRAIDVMLGPAFSKAQAYAYIDDLLADPSALKRLKYIIFDGWEWHRDNGWKRTEFTGADKHRDHPHLSGWAPDDENAAPWPAVYGGTMADPKLDSLHAGHFYGGRDNGTKVLPPYRNPKPANVQAGNNSDLEQWAELRGETALLRADVTTLLDRPPVVAAPPDIAELVLALTPVIRAIVREELDKTRLVGG